MKLQRGESRWRTEKEEREENRKNERDEKEISGEIGGVKFFFFILQYYEQYNSMFRIVLYITVLQKNLQYYRLQFPDSRVS